MWCVASAPIVPLARDLDAALGMPRGELAVHFRKLSTPLPTTPLPSRAAPAFFPQGALPLSRPLLYLEPHPRFFHTPPTPLLLSADLSPRLPAPAPRPARLHAIPSAWPPPQWGLSSENTKNEHRSLGSGARFGLLSGRKRPVFLMFQKPQPKKTERTSCAKRMRMNMARG